MLLLENIRLFNSLSSPTNVLMENGRIAEITSNTLDCENTVQGEGNILLPGLIDGHVHFRVPGGEHKEDWVTGSKAAIAGGITTVLDMPNTNPATTTLSLLEEKRAIAGRDSYCNFGLYLGATIHNISEIEKAERIAGVKVYAGSSTGDLLIEKDADVQKIFETAFAHNILVVCHAEHEHTMKENTLKARNNFWNHAKYHSHIRTAEVEAMSIEKLLAIQKKIGNKVHFAHVSSKIGLDLIKEAKKDGYWVTAEVCPHHLFLSEAATEEKGNLAKMNPSLKSVRDARSLWKFIADGTVDIVATDHAPHTLKEKNQEYYDAPSGIPGVQTMLPLLLTAVHAEKLSLERLAELCCSKPAELFGIKERGILKEGNYADLTLIDFEKQGTIKNEDQYSKCGWTCFDGLSVQGAVDKTLVNGNLVYHNHSFFENRGMEVY